MLIDPFKNYTQTPDPDRFNMHTHEAYEIFCFLSGDANYFVEGNVYKLKKNDILIIRKAESHSLLVRSIVPYERMGVHFSDDAVFPENKKLLDFLNQKPLGKSNRYAAENCGDTNWVYYLEKMCKSADTATQRIYLNVILNELYENADKAKEGLHLHNDTTKIIKYINENLTTIKNLEQIANRFFISKTQLNRNFKQVTGTTVWEYIITKRLLFAKECLKNGITPTIVAEKSGFFDYCSFFKLYKKRFGVSPKKDYVKNSQA